MLSIQIDTKRLELVNIKLTFFASHMKSSFPLCTISRCCTVIRYSRVETLKNFIHSVWNKMKCSFSLDIFSWQQTRLALLISWKRNCRIIRRNGRVKQQTRGLLARIWQKGFLCSSSVLNDIAQLAQLWWEERCCKSFLSLLSLCYLLLHPTKSFSF